MRKLYKVSTRNIRGVWIITSVLFLMWFVLFLTSQGGIRISDLALLVVLCYAMPTLLTFFVYITIDDRELTLPKAGVFRKSILIKNITALDFRPYGLGLFKGILVDYRNDSGANKTAIFPSMSTFGTIKTAQMIKQLTDVNPSIKIDPKIPALLNR
jgi:hypothetical protein